MDFGLDEADRAKTWQQYHCTLQSFDEQVSRGRWHDEPLELYTTYRDPHETAASWVNKGKRDFKSKWFEQWEAWGKSLPYAEKIFDMHELKNHHGHNSNHTLVKPWDLDYFYSIVPLSWIEHAQQCAKPYR